MVMLSNVRQSAVGLTHRVGRDNIPRSENPTAPGDGWEELVAAAVLEKEIFKKTRSMIYVYQLDQVRALSSKTTAPSIIESNQ